MSEDTVSLAEHLRVQEIAIERGRKLIEANDKIIYIASLLDRAASNVRFIQELSMRKDDEVFRHIDALDGLIQSIRNRMKDAA